MSVQVAENAGFCFGVRRATDRVEAMLADPASGRVCILGHLIHNRLYNESLERRGVCHVTVEDTARLAAESDMGGEVTVVIRTHGIPKEEEEHLLALERVHPHFHVADMTCPFVRKIHTIADENTGEDSVFFLLGSENHPEVQGILSHVGGEKHVFTRSEELAKLLSEADLVGKTPVFAAQTTQNLSEWEKTQKIIKKVCTNPKKFATILKTFNIGGSI